MNGSTHTLSDARRCFPWRGNAVLQGWLGKGLAAAEHASTGTGDHYKLTIGQVVHLGLCDQLSIIGAFNRPDDLSISLGPDGCFCLHHTDAPQRVIDYCETNDFNVIVIVECRYVGVDYRDSRSKRERITYSAAFINRQALGTEVDAWQRASTESGFTRVFIDVGKIHEHVMSAIREGS